MLACNITTKEFVVFSVTVMPHSVWDVTLVFEFPAEIARAPIIKARERADLVLVSR